MKNFFSSNPLKKVQPELFELEKNIKNVANISNKVEAIVKLFQVISPLYDKNPFAAASLKLGRKKGKYAKQLEALAILQKHFNNAGRSPYGMNRTEEGEMVTEDKIYIGNVFGLCTNTVSYWLGEKSNLEKTFRPDVSKDQNHPLSNWDLINDYQCGTFVKSHVDGILKQVAILKVDDN